MKLLWKGIFRGVLSIVSLLILHIWQNGRLLILKLDRNSKNGSSVKMYIDEQMNQQLYVQINLDNLRRDSSRLIYQMLIDEY